MIPRHPFSLRLARFNARKLRKEALEMAKDLASKPQAKNSGLQHMQQMSAGHAGRTEIQEKDVRYLKSLQTASGEFIKENFGGSFVEWKMQAAGSPGSIRWLRNLRAKS
ncbi:MAG: hypothetical protein Q9209_005001 [Squamulea sp. 1 TL-2023]